MTLYLVNTPAAEKFLTLANTNAGRRSMLGDADKFKGMGQVIRDAHDVLQKGVERAIALVNDRTRTDVAKHDAAKRIAEDTANQLAVQRNQLARKAEDLMQDGQASADAFFEMRTERGAIDAQIIAWVKEQSAKDGGVAEIRKTAMEEPQLAAVIYNAPNFLLGINANSHQKMRLDVVEKHAPNAYKAMDQGVEMQSLLSRYDKAIAGVHSSFYNPTVAAQAETHVAVA
jgi:ATP-dependent protease HslVU (ClpYQ) ATPase subunit